MSMETVAIKPDERSLSAAHRDHFMEAMSRILGSRTFSKSTRLSAFLRYVCMTTAAGSEKILCEQNIGTAVFGRPDHFNPSDDTIVRSSARLLRQRLAAYYEEEGRQDRFRISIPRGSYVPVFVDATPPKSTPEDQAAARLNPAAVVAPLEKSVSVAVPGVTTGAIAETKQTAPTTQAALITPTEPAAATIPDAPWSGPASATFPLSTLAAPVRRHCLYAVLTLPILAGLIFLQLRGVGVTPAGAIDRFWAAMLPGDTDTSLIVADNGLVMYQGEVRRQVELSDYNTNYPGDADTAGTARSVAHYGARRYTAMSSVTLASELGKRARAAPQRFHVRFARDVHLADL